MELNELYRIRTKKQQKKFAQISHCRHLTSFISICNSRNISATNNCIITNQIRPELYYVFDTIVPCLVNSSSLIHLPSSAFDSSFPPPVQ